MNNEKSPQRLYLMQVGSMPEYQVPVVCYLIQTGDGKNILIDSGLPEVIPADSSDFVNGEDVIAQIAKLGLKPGDIDLVISSHYDGDHAGRHSLFTKAEYVVQRAHHEGAKTNPRFASIRSEWDQSEERIRMVDGDTELLPGLKLIETSGHVVGHQSVLLTLPKTGKVLLTIDAVSFGSGFTLEPKEAWSHPDGEAGRASIAKLLELADKENVDMVIFGHDDEQLKTLKKLPEYYN